MRKDRGRNRLPRKSDRERKIREAIDRAMRQESRTDVPSPKPKSVLAAKLEQELSEKQAKSAPKPPDKRSPPRPKREKKVVRRAKVGDGPKDRALNQSERKKQAASPARRVRKPRSG